MDSPYDVYVGLEDEILDLKLTHLFTLKQMSINRTPQVRYQLMQNARKFLGETALSTAKFYRILDKLENLGLVKFSEEVDNKKYIITEKGLQFASSIQELVVQPGLNVMKYFQSQLEDISKFVLTNASNVLLVDFSGFVELPILEYVASKVEFLSIYTNREKYEWLNRDISNLRHVDDDKQNLLEPSDSFDTILTMYPCNASNLDIYDELHRVLHSEGSLFVYEADEIKMDHYVLEILFDAFAPIMYKERRDLSTTMHSIISNRGWTKKDTVELNGLLIYRIGK